jgi:hypothetical protein
MNFTKQQKDKIINRSIDALSASVKKISFLLEEEEEQQSIIYKQAFASKEIQESILRNLNKNEQQTN